MNFRRYTAILILVGFVSMMFCGFILTDHGLNHAIDHTSPDAAEHHFSIYKEFSLALISKVVAALSALILLIVLASIAFRYFASLLDSRRAVLCGIPLEPDDHRKRPSKTLRWLSLFENSPSIR